MNIVHTFLYLLCFTLVFAAVTRAEDDWSSFDANIGWEFQNLKTTIPANGDENRPTSASDSSRSGFRIRLQLQDLDVKGEFGDGAEGRLIFLPIKMELDPREREHVTGFGRVIGADGNPTPVRRFIGALVQGAYRSADRRLFARGKLVAVDYDRDRGYWDWRILDAEVGLRRVRTLGNGSAVVFLEASIGSGIGGLELKNFAEIQEALNVSPVMATTPTLNPYVRVVTGVHLPRWKVELGGTAEQRVDLRSRQLKAEYLEHPIDVHSTRTEAVFDAEYFISDATRWITADGPSVRTSRFSVYTRASYERDTLTFGRVLFDSNDRFQSIQLGAGLRGRF